MLVEKSRAEAIKAFLNGKQVRVITEFDDGSMAIELIEEILPEEDTHYLVDVPAVEDPEFRQAVADMVHGSDQDAVDEKDSVEGDILPPLTGPETEQPSAGKSKKDLVLELSAKGLSVKEIADRIGAKYNTVYYWIHAKTQKKPGWNQDRHACRTCVYRATGTLKTNGAGCDYVTITQRIRDCSVEDCDKYIKGAPKSKKQVKDNGKENE